MPEDDSQESKHVAKIIMYVILKLNKYTIILLCRRKYIVDLRYIDYEEHNSLYTSRNILWVIKSRRMRWARYVARMGEVRVVYRVLVKKPEGKRSLWRPRRRWEGNIKRHLQELGCGEIDWI